MMNKRIEMNEEMLSQVIGGLYIKDKHSIINNTIFRKTDGRNADDTVFRGEHADTLKTVLKTTRKNSKESVSL